MVDNVLVYFRLQESEHHACQPSYLCSVGYGVKLILIWKKMEYISGPQCVDVNMCKCNTKLGYKSVS